MVETAYQIHVSGLKPYCHFANLVKPQGQNNPLVLFVKYIANQLPLNSLFTEAVFYGSILRWHFSTQASCHKLLLDSLHSTDALAREFRDITDAIALLQKAYYFPIFILLLFKALDRPRLSAKFTALGNILLSP